jgi:predicted nucleic acid-binding protein
VSADAVYLDTSAFVKTIVVEPESKALRRWLVARPLHVSSALLRVESVRALAEQGAEAVARARTGLRLVTLIAIDDEILDAAADLPGQVRSLDAIHLASARSLGEDLSVLVTYDRRMAAAAQALGFAVEAP